MNVSPQPATGTSPPPGDTQALKFERPSRVCLITLGGERFAVDLRYVREVIEWDALTPVPGMPPHVLGVTNVRGQVIPVVDIRSMLRFAAQDPRPNFAVIIRHGAHQLGVIVECVPEIRSIRPDNLLPVAETGGMASRPFVCAIVQVDERLGGMLDIPLVVARIDGDTMTPTYQT